MKKIPEIPLVPDYIVGVQYLEFEMRPQYQSDSLASDSHL
jgi:hypothetical protein